MSDSTRGSEGRQISIRERLGKAHGVPFPCFYADAIATRDAPHGMIQITFAYLPILEELFELTGPDEETVPEEVEADAYVVAHVTVPKAAFDQWFGQLASRRGLLPPASDSEVEDD
ncbi:MAG: hypothetical protein ACE5R4_09490 [Armatimonadota bacterium]